MSHKISTSDPPIDQQNASQSQVDVAGAIQSGSENREFLLRSDLLKCSIFPKYLEARLN
jgi:hypothetical protein